MVLLFRLSNCITSTPIKLRGSSAQTDLSPVDWGLPLSKPKYEHALSGLGLPQLIFLRHVQCSFLSMFIIINQLTNRDILLNKSKLIKQMKWLPNSFIKTDMQSFGRTKATERYTCAIEWSEQPAHPHTLVSLVLCALQSTESFFMRAVQTAESTCMPF